MSFAGMLRFSWDVEWDVESCSNYYIEQVFLNRSPSVLGFHTGQKSISSWYGKKGIFSASGKLLVLCDIIPESALSILRIQGL